MSIEAYEVPLIEQLASVPNDARLVIDDADGMGTRFIPVGRMCHEAAIALRQAIAEAEKQEPVAVISAKELSSMSQDLKGVDTSQSGYHWRVGWNAALRQAMDYSMPPLYTHPQPKREWVGLEPSDWPLPQYEYSQDFQIGALWSADILKEKNT